MTNSPPVLTPASAQAPRTSPLAVWSLILGILSIFCLWVLGSIPAIIMGAIAMKRSNENPQEVGGKGLALAGIITGGVGILTGLITVGIYASAMIPAYSGVQSRAEEVRTISSVRIISLGLSSYSADHDGSFPPTLEELIPDYLDSEEGIYQVDPDSGDSSPFLYRPGLTKSDDSDTIIVLAPFSINGKRVVGYLDGRAESMREPLPADLLGTLE